MLIVLLRVVDTFANAGFVSFPLALLIIIIALFYRSRLEQSRLGMAFPGLC